MFLDNKYTHWYYSIMRNASNRQNNGYTERHHIIPKALGGDNNSNNLVRLTAKEHFTAHRLLIKMTTGKEKMKMSFAYHCLFINNQKHQRRLELNFTSRQYEERKKALATATSLLHKGKKVSKETIAKMLETRKQNNKPYPDEARRIHSIHSKELWANNYEKMVTAHRTPEVREKISKANKGVNRHSAAGRQQISERNSGSGNGRARRIIVTSPTGERFECFGNFHIFCKKHKLPSSSMCHILHKTRSFTKGATVGWSAEYNDI